MNITSTTPVSSILSAQAVEASIVKLANDQTKANGEIALQLIQSVPQPTGSIGNNINVSV